MTSTAVMVETGIGTDRRKRSLRPDSRARRRFMPCVSISGREDADIKRNFTAANYGLS
jgi:hypothetical protein